MLTRCILVTVLYGLALTTTIGCGGPSKLELTLVPVTGTVKVKGKPEPGITVVFYPADGAGPSQVAAVGRTDDDGRYELTSNGQSGAALGKYRVLLSKMVKPDGSLLVGEEMATEVDAKNALPDVYNNPVETPLGAEVLTDGGNFDFEARSK